MVIVVEENYNIQFLGKIKISKRFLNMNEKVQENLDFEKLVELSKNALDQLNNQNLPLKESLKIYKQGLQYLNDAQKLLEEAKLEYEILNTNQE